MKTLPVVALTLAALSLTACGIITFPISLGSAVAQNASFTFNGRITDAAGVSLDGVIVKLANSHHVWTPLAGSKDLDSTLIRRADGKFAFENRGSWCEFTFSKDGYHDAYFRLSAGQENTVFTRDGNWKMADNFPVVMLSSRTPAARLQRYNAPFPIANYPNLRPISLPNLAANGSTGDVVYQPKDAEDPTVFPAGTLYLTLDKEPPTALNAKGDIDVADLDIPHHVTLHLPGPDAGFVAIEPKLGYHPMFTSDLAPASGYVHELTFTRLRLKEMRAAAAEEIVAAHEYFYFHAGRHFGKGVFSWSWDQGKPAFHFDLYIGQEPDNRDLHLVKS